MNAIDFPDGLAAPGPLHLLGPDAGDVSAEVRAALHLRRVLQRVRLRLSTVRGSVPLDRTFGLDPNVLDAPVSQVARLRVAVAEALRGESDVRLQRVEVDRSVTAGALGRVPVRVVLEVLPMPA